MRVGKTLLALVAFAGMLFTVAPAQAQDRHDHWRHHHQWHHHRHCWWRHHHRVCRYR